MKRKGSLADKQIKAKHIASRATMQLTYADSNAPKAAEKEEVMKRKERDVVTLPSMSGFLGIKRKQKNDIMRK